MATFEELEMYYQKLKSAFTYSGNASSHYNSDRSHNAMVMCFMFDNSSSIDMYCGQLSVFRENFYGHIKEYYGDDQISNYLKKRLVSSFNNFIQQSNSSFNVIFESDNEDYSKDLICKELFLEGIENEKIHVYKLDDNLSFKQDLYHFSYTNSQIVRLEEDKIKHSAICTINDVAIYDSAKNSFSKLLLLAHPVLNIQ